MFLGVVCVCGGGGEGALCVWGAGGEGALWHPRA